MTVKKIIGAALCFCAVSALADVPAPDAPKELLEGDYKLNPTFSDEFGSGKIDASKWIDFYPTWNGRAPGFIDRKNVSVRDGMLVLTARAVNPEEVAPELRAEGKDKFSTANFRSKTRVLYGYYEVKFKAMNAAVCNAFWLNDPVDPPKKYQRGEKTEEIDIFELFGNTAGSPRKYPEGSPDRIYFMTTHRASTPYVESKVWLDREVVETRLAVSESFSERWHTAGLLWTPEKLVWVLDGKAVLERTNEYFNRPLYLNIDCEIMKGWVGEPNPATLPSEFQIEYVRVWQK